jgi:tape measure domain-containing protein
MASDQLRLDISVVNGDAALRQLDALDAKVKTLPQSAQQGAAGVEAAARRQADAMERESARATAAVDREARKAADAQIREITRANQASLKAFDDELARRERLAKAQAGGFLGSAGPVAGLASTIGRGAALGVGYEALGAIQAGLEGIGSAAVGMNNRLEQARIGFTTMLGSAEKADAFLKDLAQFAATTPFEFPDLVTASQRMLAMGFAADQVRPLLTAVGNAAAALGSGKEGIDRITTALGQMQAKSKVQADEMRQLAEAGIPAWDILAKKLNTDVVTAMAQVEARTVSATTFITAFQEASKERYGDMMAQQSRTYAGAMSTISDNTQMAIAQGFKPLFAVLTEATVAMADFTQTDNWTAWANGVTAATGQVASGIRATQQGVQGAGTLAGQAAGALAPELAAGADVVRRTGVDVGGAYWAAVQLGVREAASFTPLGPVLAAATGVELLGGVARQQAAAEGQRIGADYVQNVTAAIAASAPQGAEIAGAAIEGIVRDMTSRGFSEDQAREVAALYWGQVARGLADKRPDLENAGLYMSQAVADGILAGQHLVGTAAASLATLAGAAVAANKGNLEKAIMDVIAQASQVGFSPNAMASLVAETEQQANAYKGVAAALGTLAPAERARYELMLRSQGTMAVLNQLSADGRITDEQRNAVLQQGQGLLVGQAQAERTRTEALEAARTADLGGALAVQQHNEAREREKEAALGGAVAIRTHAEDLAREKEQALGGALAIRQHGEDLAREKEQALGGALAIRQHSEDLAREKEAALGGRRRHPGPRGCARSVRRRRRSAGRWRSARTAKQLQREHEAALGGVAAIRDHEDALNREKTAALGGEVGIRAHAEALNEEKIAALGGRAAILDHQAALQQLDAEAQQSRTVFVDLADKMANYAKSTNEAAVAQSIGYANANQATSAALKELTGAQQAEVKALQNAGDAYGALTTALEQAGVGYQDIAGLINGEREATERLNESIQRNTQYRAAQRTAIQQANETQFRAAITATGQGGGLPQYLPAGGGGGEQLPQVQGLNEWMNRFPGMFQQAVDQVLARQGSGTTQDVFAQLNTMFGQWTTQNNAVIASDQARAKATDADTHATQAHSGAVVRATQDAHQNLDNLVDAMGPLPGVTNEFGQRVLQSAGEMQNFYARWRDLSRASALQSDVLGRLNDDLALTARTTSAGGDQVAAAAARAALQISDLAANTGQSVAEVQRLAQAAGAAAAATWQIAQAVGAALQAGQMRNAGVAGGVTEKGLTYGEIYGNTGTTAAGVRRLQSGRGQSQPRQLLRLARDGAADGRHVARLRHGRPHRPADDSRGSGQYAPLRAGGRGGPRMGRAAGRGCRPLGQCHRQRRRCAAGHAPLGATGRPPDRARVAEAGAGDMTLPNRPWVVQVDWADADTSPPWSDADTLTYTAAVQRIDIERRAFHRSLRSDTCSVTLIDSGFDIRPSKGSSALWPNVLLGRRLRVLAQSGPGTGVW